MFLPGLFLAAVFVLIVAGAQVALELALPLPAGTIALEPDK
jgi:hypothetical protein